MEITMFNIFPKNHGNHNFHNMFSSKIMIITIFITCFPKNHGNHHFYNVFFLKNMEMMSHHHFKTACCCRSRSGAVPFIPAERLPGVPQALQLLWENVAPRLGRVVRPKHGVKQGKNEEIIWK